MNRLQLRDLTHVEVTISMTPADKGGIGVQTGQIKDRLPPPLVPLKKHAVGLDSDTDTQLMLRVKNGDSESFSILLKRNRNIVIAYLSRMVQNQAIAGELAQDVFVRIFRSRAKYRATAKFCTWLYRIATNVALNYFRKEKGSLQNVGLDAQEGAWVRLVATDRALLVEDRLTREAVANHVRRAVQALPARQRSVVIMHKYEEMGYEQIACALGCTLLAVKALLFRACSALRIHLRGLPTGSHATKKLLLDGRS
jgi:RNA polymerase sigma-70 factor (ECF subfamily)